MTNARLSASLPSPDATAALAGAMAPGLRAGDVLLLDGPVGAGKTMFARALIGALRARAGLAAEDVPSPTYTLVQTYATGAFETWHADLYRLASADDVLELGLEDGFRDALCLIEWPDRLGADRPDGAARLTFRIETGDTRHLILEAPAETIDRLAPAFGDRAA